MEKSQQKNQRCSKCGQSDSSQSWTEICFICYSQNQLAISFNKPQVTTHIQYPLKQQKDKKRCFNCNKNVGLLGIQCKCGFIFCTMHRLPESHECQIDFRQIARLKLKQQQQISKKKASQYAHIQCIKCGQWIKKNLVAGHMHSHASMVMERLLLGDKVCSKNKEQLIVKHKVTHVVNAAVGLKNYFEHKGVKYINLSLQDNHQQQLINQALMAAQFIDQAIKSGGVVFVHCYKGKSRSVSVIIMYLMMYLQMDYQESLLLIKNARPIAKPNQSYQRQLKLFYHTVLKPN